MNGAGLTLFDIEQDVVYPAYAEEDIDITHDTIVGQNYGYLLSAQTGSELERVAFTHNALTAGAQLRIFMRPARVRRHSQQFRCWSQATPTRPHRPGLTRPCSSTT